MLGLPKGEVFLVPWSHRWVQEFEAEKSLIETKIGDYILAVHHIGSTAVQGLSAKPILDIAIEVDRFELGEMCVTALEEMGYDYKGTDILPDRHYFSKGEPRTHQIHMYERGNHYLTEQLNFRDYLRKNEDAKEDYERFKIRLSKAHETDKHRYAKDKTDFVKTILRKIETLE
ncbi:GrpB family protein [Chryseomicrobium sp. FSL W7-1435]|uniref:GrpB family protein n=1 Tax=Chryseomicrobium sp. FSL W7-1435 TaxID=2921704 RepID=UPI00315AB24F